MCAFSVQIEKTTELSRRERFVEASVFVFPLQYDPYEFTDEEALLCASYML